VVFIAAGEFDANDRRLTAGKRTGFFVYLVDAGTNPKYQVVPFASSLKKLTIYFDSACAFNVQIEARIDGKVIARARGASEKVKFDISEPIPPNAKVEFESTEIAATADWHAVVYGEIVC